MCLAIAVSLSLISGYAYWRAQKNKTSAIDNPKIVKIEQDIETSTQRFVVHESFEVNEISVQNNVNLIKAKPSYKFVVVDLSVTSRVRGLYKFPGYDLIDSQKRKYASMPTDKPVYKYMDTEPLFPLLNRDLAYGIRESGVLIYEIPSDVTTYSLLVEQIKPDGKIEYYKVILK